MHMWLQKVPCLRYHGEEEAVRTQTQVLRVRPLSSNRTPHSLYGMGLSSSLTEPSSKEPHSLLLFDSHSRPQTWKHNSVWVAFLQIQFETWASGLAILSSKIPSSFGILSLALCWDSILPASQAVIWEVKSLSTMHVSGEQLMFSFLMARCTRGPFHATHFVQSLPFTNTTECKVGLEREREGGFSLNLPRFFFFQSLLWHLSPMPLSVVFLKNKLPWSSFSLPSGWIRTPKHDLSEPLSSKAYPFWSLISHYFSPGIFCCSSIELFAAAGNTSGGYVPPCFGASGVSSSSASHSLHCIPSELPNSRFCKT